MGHCTRERMMSDTVQHCHFTQATTTEDNGKNFAYNRLFEKEITKIWEHKKNNASEKGTSAMTTENKDEYKAVCCTCDDVTKGKME